MRAVESSVSGEIFPKLQYTSVKKIMYIYIYVNNNKYKLNDNEFVKPHLIIKKTNILSTSCVYFLAAKIVQQTHQRVIPASLRTLFHRSWQRANRVLKGDQMWSVILTIVENVGLFMMCSYIPCLCYVSVWDCQTVQRLYFYIYIYICNHI